MKLLLENWRRYLNENKEEMLKMSLHDFDQTKNGWRKFKDPKQQVEIITSYLETNPAAANDQTFMWHLGQALVFAGDLTNGIARMKETNAKEQHEFNKLYQLFTIAFLEKDMTSFDVLYDKYKEQIEKDDKNTNKNTNIQIVKCMKQCASKGNFDYKAAYTTRCPCQ